MEKRIAICCVEQENRASCPSVMRMAMFWNSVCGGMELDRSDGWASNPR